ncbi:DNA-binding response regulator [Rhodococcus sp. WMMA185]|nr:LytTR family DNA-binding domain-containing protein [Rhodococcus sp. WMMA185]AOW94972.1 DNA-binding response regulator [Rhodococcus sp. WMMA185]
MTGTNDSLTVLAVDDEKPALDELAFLLNAQDAVGEIRLASEATAALRVLQDRDIDAVFLDINMPGLDGLELAGILSNYSSPPPVVFVTAHDDRAVDAFELGAIDYVLKPLREERIAESVRRIVESVNREGRGRSGVQDVGAVSDEVIPVELGGSTTLVHRSSVEWVEADGDYTRLHTADGSHLVRIPISALEKRWAEAGFLRVHRSHLVSMPLVTGTRTVGNGLVVCLRARGDRPPVELPVSRRHTRMLKDTLVRASKRSWTAR